jgi:hypothetical protein
MDRAFASGYTSSLTDADAPAVAAICSRLDGVALAIELAGSRVGLWDPGDRRPAEQSIQAPLAGSPQAPARHQTLHAMLDWSFNLLSARDRRVLGRLSIFVGPFTLEAAQAVAADDQIDAMEAADAIASLINKSLIWVAPIDGIAHHRLLDSTLAFAAEKLAQTAEANAVAKQHALYYAQYLSSRAGKGFSREDVAGTGPYLGNIRAAWNGVFPAPAKRRSEYGWQRRRRHCSFIIPCSSNAFAGASRAWLHCPKATKGARPPGAAGSFLAASVMLTRGNSDEVRKAIEDALSLADAGRPGASDAPPWSVWASS